MEPLLPKGQSIRLSELTCEILKASGRLTGQVHSAFVLKRVADLVREMNCYYSNLIEGHKTIPRDIERAMKRDFSHDQTMLDQIRFMSELLGLPALRTRVERYFQFQALHLDRYREELMRVARTLVDEGEIPRARVQEITGKAATVSVEIIKLGLDEGYFETPSPKGPLRVAFPAKIHEFYFPQLFLDLPVEPPAGRAA